MERFPSDPWQSQRFGCGAIGPFPPPYIVKAFWLSFVGSIMVALGPSPTMFNGHGTTSAELILYVPDGKYSVGHEDPCGFVVAHAIAASMAQVESFWPVGSAALEHPAPKSESLTSTRGSFDTLFGVVSVPLRLPPVKGSSVAADAST